jgi:hypothetical protein
VNATRAHLSEGDFVRSGDGGLGKVNPVMAIVLGMVTGIGGGMVRDVLLAEIPRCFVRNYMPSRRWQPLPSL